MRKEISESTSTEQEDEDKVGVKVLVVGSCTAAAVSTMGVVGDVDGVSCVVMVVAQVVVVVVVVEEEEGEEEEDVIVEGLESIVSIDTSCVCRRCGVTLEGWSCAV